MANNNIKIHRFYLLLDNTCLIFMYEPCTSLLIDELIFFVQVLLWVRQFIYLCTLPAVMLSSIACSWTLVNSKGLLSFSPVLQSARQVFFELSADRVLFCDITL